MDEAAREAILKAINYQNGDMVSEETRKKLENKRSGSHYFWKCLYEARRRTEKQLSNIQSILE